MSGDLSDHFSRREFKCNCGRCDHDTVDVELIKVLEEIRTAVENRTILITSGNRCVDYNKLCGGRPRSMHLVGKAADIVTVGMSAKVVQEIINQLYPNKYGVGYGKIFTHIDVREEKTRWTYTN